MRRLKFKGFTLIELLVVISIIAMLLSIMLPSLNRVRERAKEVYCATNFKQLGMASEMYTQNNKGKIVSAVFEIPGGNPPYQFWVNLLRPYIGIVQQDYKGEQAKVFMCPSDKTQGGLWELGARPNGVQRDTSYYLRSYNINGQVENLKQTEVRRPTATVLATESQWWLHGYMNYCYPWRGSEANAIFYLVTYPGVDMTKYPSYRHLAQFSKNWHRKQVNILFVDGHIQMLEVDSLFPGKENEKIFRWK